MNELLRLIINSYNGDVIIQMCAWCIVGDTIFGIMRAVKERKFNSCFGIDGAIRKVTMIVSLFFLTVIDHTVHIDLLGFVPQEIALLINLKTVGTADFFGLMYIAYESVSILKNITLCGANTKGVYKFVRRFLSKYTTELPEEN